VSRKIVYKIQFHPPPTAYKVMAKGARHFKTLYCVRSVGRKIGLLLGAIFGTVHGLKVLLCKVGKDSESVNRLHNICVLYGPFIDQNLKWNHK
jgi:hypothetical protein